MIASAACRARLAAIALSLLVGLPLSASAQAPQPVFEFKQLAADVWAAVLREKGPYAITNSLIVISDTGVLVVDTQQSKAAVQEVIAKIRELTPRPVRWVVNTHEHLDHVGGNDAYLQAFGPGVAIIGHDRQKSAVDSSTRAALASEVDRRAVELREQRAQFERIKDNPLLPPAVGARMSRGLEDLAAYLEDLRGLQLRPVSETFTTTRVLRLGSREVQLIHPGPAHTTGDVAVWLPADGILAMGDLVEDGLSLVGETSTPTGWAAALDSLARLDVKTLVPAHGPVQSRALLDRQKNLFGSVVREAKRARAEGLMLEQAWDRIAAAADTAIRAAPDPLATLPPGSLTNWLELAIPKAWSEAGG
jgi:cyclase